MDRNDIDADDIHQQGVYQAALRAASARGLPRSDAEDVAMDTVLAGLGQDVVANPGGFGTSVGRNKTVDEIRRRERQARPTSDIGAFTDGQPVRDHAEDTLLRLLVAALVEIADAELTSSQRQAFDALVLQGGNVADAVRFVARSTGRDPSTMRTHMDRALGKLRDRAAHLDPYLDQ